MSLLIYVFKSAINRDTYCFKVRWYMSNHNRKLNIFHIQKTILFSYDLARTQTEEKLRCFSC